MFSALRIAETIFDKTKNNDLTWGVDSNDPNCFYSSILGSGRYKIRLKLQREHSWRLWVEHVRVDSVTSTIIVNHQLEVSADHYKLAALQGLLGSLGELLEAKRMGEDPDEYFGPFLLNMLNWELGFRSPIAAEASGM